MAKKGYYKKKEHIKLSWRKEVRLTQKMLVLTMRWQKRMKNLEFANEVLVGPEQAPLQDTLFEILLWSEGCDMHNPPYNLNFPMMNK